VTLNIFDIKFSVDFSTREDWSTECVDLVAPDGLVFFTDGSLCEGKAGAGVFSDILNVRESYALGSHATVFQSEVYAFLACSEYCISEGTVNRAISSCFGLKSYAVSSRVVLQCEDSLQELALSNRVRLDTMVSMEMRRPMQLQEQDQVLILWGRSLVFRWQFLSNFVAQDWSLLSPNMSNLKCLEKHFVFDNFSVYYLKITQKS
jgi:hypothetical protein